MSLDINKVIMESIGKLTGQDEVVEEGVYDSARRVGEKAYTKVYGAHEDDPALKTGAQKHLLNAFKRAKMAVAGRTAGDEEAASMGVQHHLSRAGRRALHWASSEHPEVGAGALVAAAIGAGLGAKALAKKLRAKKGKGKGKK